MTSLHYVALPSLHEPPLTLAGRLAHPGGDGPSAGGDPAARLRRPERARGRLRRAAERRRLRDAGARPVVAARARRRRRGPPAHGARDLARPLRRPRLAGRPPAGRSPRRIGVAGFSFGAVATMLAATRAHNEPFLGEDHFAALMPVYPICHLYNRAARLRIRRPGRCARC